MGHATLNLALALLRSGARAIVAGEKGALVGELQALGGEWMEFAFSTSHPLRRRANVEQAARTGRQAESDPNS